MRVKFTRASKHDTDKFTIRTSQLGFKNLFVKDGTKVFVTLKSGRKEYDVILTASRGGKTLYGPCPKGLSMPTVGKPKYYTVAQPNTRFFDLLYA